ncbi:MAG: DUF4765 family protein [Candidatus Competibacterales bacterium]|nr:DUF4765 family protein [Candidatus Competibacterales bacterium]
MLPPPTSEKTVEQSGPDAVVCLWRGTRPETARRVEQTKTAGGYDTSQTPGLVPRAPSEEEVVAQVAGASMGGTQAVKRLPEYTTSQFWARNYATGAILCIAIKRKFLTKGSVSEGGWVMYPEAPVEGAIWENYTSAKSTSTSLINPKTGKRIIGD